MCLGGDVCVGRGVCTWGDVCVGGGGCVHGEMCVCGVGVCGEGYVFGRECVCGKMCKCLLVMYWHPHDRCADLEPRAFSQLRCTSASYSSVELPLSCLLDGAIPSYQREEEFTVTPLYFMIAIATCFCCDA